MFYAKGRRKATYEMIQSLIDRNYNEELPKLESMFKELLSDHKPSEEEMNEIINSCDNSWNVELLNNIDYYEKQLQELTDLAIILDDEYMPYENEEEYQLCLNYFISKSPDLLLAILQIINLLKEK